MHSKSGYVEIMINNKKGQVTEEHFQSLLFSFKPK